MGLKLNSKLSYAFLMSSVMLAATPLKAVESDFENPEGSKAVLRKVEASQNVLFPENQQEKSHPIGVSITDPREPFTLQYMAQKGIVMMIDKHAENWVEIAEQSLEHIRKFRGITDFGNFEQEIYEAAISHFAPKAMSYEYYTGVHFLPSQLTSRVDTLFAETKDEESQRSMERAISHHFSAWNCFQLIKKFWNKLCSFQGKEEGDFSESKESSHDSRSVLNFRDRFREALALTNTEWSFALSKQDLKENSAVIDMFGSLRVLSLGWVDDEFLGELAKYKSIKKLEFHCVVPESMDLLGKLSQIEVLYLDANNISDISPIAEMPNLHTLRLYYKEDLCKVRKIDVSPLLDSPSLKNVTFWGRFDISSLKEKFEVVEEKRSSVTFERKKHSENKSQN